MNNSEKSDVLVPFLLKIGLPLVLLLKFWGPLSIWEQWISCWLTFLEFWPSSCWAALFVIACIIIYLYIICLSNNFSVMTRWEIVFSDMGTMLVLHNVFLRGCRRSGLGKEIISGNQGEGRVVKGGHIWGQEGSIQALWVAVIAQVILCFFEKLDV